MSETNVGLMDRRFSFLHKLHMKKMPLAEKSEGAQPMVAI